MSFNRPTEKIKAEEPYHAVTGFNVNAAELKRENWKNGHLVINASDLLAGTKEGDIVSLIYPGTGGSRHYGKIVSITRNPDLRFDVEIEVLE